MDQLDIGSGFDTARLNVGPWHAAAEFAGRDLAAIVTRLLTASTTAELPEPWRGSYDQQRAESWIAERDAESPTLLAVERDSGAVVGLLILFVDDADLRLGYVIADDQAGRGYASELVGGLISWARDVHQVDTITSGVSINNPASARVLERNGFTAIEQGEDENTYRVVVS